MRKIACIVGLLALRRIIAEGSSNYAEDFKMYDLDKNGLIDPQEIRTVYGMDGSLSEEELHAFWTAVDPKNKGSFNLEDFINYAMRHSQTSDEI